MDEPKNSADEKASRMRDALEAKTQSSKSTRSHAGELSRNNGDDIVALPVEKIQSVRGMNDLLPDDISGWQSVESTIRRVVRLYDYQEIRVPVLERTELFKRSIGEQTDIVEKEMYTFADNRGDSLTMRPEATASCARACIQHGLIPHQRVRLWYMGPMFRYERPQKGRYRQFHQFGVETFGWSTSDVEIEIILLAQRLWQSLGISKYTQLEINTIGNVDSRNKYRTELVNYFGKHYSQLDEDSRRRLKTNPLRILDSKNETMADMLASAPKLTDYLQGESKQRFEHLQMLLSEMEIDYTINPRLVRGLDYYTDTVFEWTTGLLGAQNAICGGGRYDGLVEILGGGSVPGAGFALGLERLVEVVQQSFYVVVDSAPEVYFCVLGTEAQVKGFQLAEQLRGAGISSIVHCGGGKLAQQLKSADRADARLSVIIGSAELESDSVIVKPLRTDIEQRTVALIDLIETIRTIEPSLQH